ncbi:hypothetical protein CAPTEDRAFT_191807, partial [Capitella teleta]
MLSLARRIRTISQESVIPRGIDDFQKETSIHRQFRSLRLIFKRYDCEISACSPFRAGSNPNKYLLGRIFLSENGIRLASFESAIMENYHVLELIGEGSFGRVYKGRKKFSGQ